MSFDETKPPSGGLLISADHRANSLATRRAGFINMLRDPLYECWPVNDSTVPPDWTLGGGATIARDTTLTRLGVGDMGARVTKGGAIAQLAQRIMVSTNYDPFFDTRIFTAGVYIHASAIGIARVQIFDGVSGTVSSLNTAANTLEFLTVEHIINAAATQIGIFCELVNPGSCTFSGATLLFSDIKPDRFIPPITVPISIPFVRRGTIFTGNIDVWLPSRSFVLDSGIVALAVAAGLGTNVIADLNWWDGASWQSMYLNLASQPTLGPGLIGPDIKVINGTYNRRCFRPAIDGSSPAGTVLGGFIDQTGVAPNEGDHLVLIARGKGWASPMEIFQ